jgi:16S rRNA processing protein RimM
MPLDKICVGVIVGAHGIKGDVKVKSFTENPFDIGEYGTLEDENGANKYELSILGTSGKVIRASIKGVNDRNKAEELKGVELFVDRSLLKQENDEEFYHADLIGLNVLIENQKSVGKIIAIYNYGAGDFLEVKGNDEKPIMIPFTKSAVPVIDVKNQFVTAKQEAIIFDERKKQKESSAKEDKEKEI